MNLVSSNLLAFAALVLVAGCGTVKKPEYHAGAAPATARVQQNVGVEVALDPFIEPERTRPYFGINAVSDGIAILHVRVANRSADQTLLVEKKNFHLLLAGSATDQTADGKKIDRGTAGGEATALVGAAAISLPLLFAGAAMISQSTEIRRNFVGKEMPDQTLSPGESMEGFIYYTPVPKGKNWSRGATMKVNLTDTRTHQVTGFDLPLGQ